MERPTFQKAKAFGRSIAIDSFVKENNAILRIAGRVKNTGAIAWDNRGEREDALFRLGVRIVSEHNLTETLQEERFDFYRRCLEPGTEIAFSFLIPIVTLPAGRYIVKLNVLKEWSFWFDDIGIACELLPFEKGAVTPDLGCEFRFTGKPVLCNSARVELAGVVRNTGSLSWDNRSLPRSKNFRVGARVFRKDKPDASLLEARYCFNRTVIQPQEELHFSLAFNVLGIPPGNYTISVNMMREFSFWFEDIGIPAACFDFERPEHVIEYNRRIELRKPVYSKHGALLKLAGRIKNTGTRAWDNSRLETERAFRIGLQIFSKDDTDFPVSEERYFLHRQRIGPGGSERFSFIVNLLTLPPGHYRARINILKEQSFWFDDIGIPSEEILFEAKRHPESPQRIPGLLAHPAKIRILIIAPSVPFFDRESGGNRMFEILRLLKKNNYRVTFVCPRSSDTPANKKYKDALKHMGIRLAFDPLDFLSRLRGDEFSICIFSWYECAKEHLAIVSHILPHAKIIVDSVDIHWLREMRAWQAGLSQLSKEEIEANKQEEVRVYRSADQVWTVTEEDRLAVLSEIPSCQVSIVSNIHRRSPGFIKQPRGDGIIFVGSFIHPPNESAALWGYEIFRAFRQKTGRHCVYYIVGTKPPETIKSLHDGKDVIVTGQVPSLAPFYKQSRVMIAPLKYGAGIKGKICHAVCSGIPVITTEIGNEGLHFIHGSEAFIAHTTDDFVAHLETVFSEGADPRGIVARALAKVLEITGEKQVWCSIKASLAYSPVTIAIVSYNKRELLKKCISSILQKTRYPRYTIAVVLNGCTDGSRQMMAEYRKKYRDRIHVYYNPSNEFFVKPNNFLIRTYKHTDIVLVNNDIEIISGDWLCRLHDAAYVSERVGAAGGKIIDGSGRLSEAGAELYNDGTGRNIGRGDSPDKKEYNIPRYVGYVSGCLLYMRRDKINRFGAFDEDFSPMYYEDSAWQYNLHKHGILTIYTPQCAVIHHEGSSAGTNILEGMKKFQEINRTKFLQKMRGVDIASLNPRDDLVARVSAW